MSVQSDAAKAHIEKLLNEAYPDIHHGYENFGELPVIKQWQKEYRFAPPRLWRFDYAVPAILCANYLSTFLRCNNHTTPPQTGKHNRD